MQHHICYPKFNCELPCTSSAQHCPKLGESHLGLSFEFEPLFFGILGTTHLNVSFLYQEGFSGDMLLI